MVPLDAVVETGNHDQNPFVGRMSPALIARIKHLATVSQGGTEEIISLALDALDREQKTGSSVRSGWPTWRKTWPFFHLVMTLNEKLDEKFAQANLTEKDQLRSLYQLLQIDMEKHDEDEKARLNQIIHSIQALGHTKTRQFFDG